MGIALKEDRTLSHGNGEAPHRRTDAHNQAQNTMFKAYAFAD
jgi:hypothetical protein